MQLNDEVLRLTIALAAPFEPDVVKWKPQAVRGNRALAIAYVDSRAIQDRLDSVVGPAGWQDDFQLTDNGSVICRLSVKIDGAWIAKVDVGSQSDQPDEGDKLKAGFSDALKRAATKFGIGRYLYRLPGQWVDYDPAKKQFTKKPTLPSWALPAKEPEDKPAPSVAAMETLAEIEKALAKLKLSPADAKKGLARYRVAEFSQLSQAQANEVLASIRAKLEGKAVSK